MIKNQDKFDNRIKVIDISGQPQNFTYFRRAKGLIKNGRAEWINENTIRILKTIDNSQTFLEYLAKKKKTQKSLDNSITLFNTFQTFLKNNSPTAEIMNEFLDYVKLKGVKGDSTGFGSGAFKAGNQFLKDYADFCGEGSAFTEALYIHNIETFELPARRAVLYHKKSIIFIPEDIKIDHYFLDGTYSRRVYISF